MVVVTGTGRCGTSSWMQALGAAGLPVLGEAFPLDWEHTVRAANPDGYFESTLAGGINFRSNPGPTGVVLEPEQTRDWACKVFLQGIPRTELRWLHHVVWCFRGHREYVASWLHAFGATHDPEGLARPYFGWWLNHVRALRDLDQRGWPCRFVDFDRLVAEPAAVVPPVIDWLGDWDVAAAVATVKPRPTSRPRPDPHPDMPTAWLDPFDELHERLRDGRALEPAWLARAERFTREVATANDVRRGATDAWATGRRRGGGEPATG